MIPNPDSPPATRAGGAVPPTTPAAPAAASPSTSAAASQAPALAPGGLGRRERMALAAVAAMLALLLFWLRGGLHPEAPLERLARQSPDLATALADGRPTLVEFYADWCEACRAMAPAMEAIEQRRRGALDVVLLNVDNPRWQPELERYAVNGIPQLELFDADGRSVGRSIGARRPEELEALTTALVEGTALPELVGVGATSSLSDASGSASAPISRDGNGPAAGADPRPTEPGAPSAADAGAMGPNTASTSADSSAGRRGDRPAPIGPRSHG